MAGYNQVLLNKITSWTSVTWIFEFHWIVSVWICSSLFRIVMPGDVKNVTKYS